MQPSQHHKDDLQRCNIPEEASFQKDLSLWDLPLGKVTPQSRRVP